MIHEFIIIRIEYVKWMPKNKSLLGSDLQFMGIIGKMSSHESIVFHY